MTHFIKLMTASALALTLAACATPYDNDKTMEDAKAEDTMMTDKVEMEMADEAEMEAPQTNIVEAAVATDSLSTLVSLVKMGGLVETLSSPGPFTVFAPTNDAFALLPAETTAALTSPENKDMLANVLKAHVISGTVTSSDLAAALESNSSYEATTVSGDTLTFYKMSDGIRIADENGTLAKIAAADLMQSNGVVHVVSSVLVPK